MLTCLTTRIFSVKKLSEQMLMVSEINYIKLGVMHLEYAQLYAQEYESSI